MLISMTNLAVCVMLMLTGTEGAVPEKVQEEVKKGGGVTTEVNGQEIDFKQISIPRAFEVLNVRPPLDISEC